MKVGRKLKKIEKLNLVPILDSVFIFIFFLLMSAQFVNVHEIGSSVPMTQELPQDKKDEKDPLNLTIEISKEQIVVKTGLKNPQSRSFASVENEKIKEYLTELKRNNPTENTMILKTDPKVPFQALIALIDTTQISKDKKEKLFEQIVFDNSGVEQ
jgi:biopolymer transport protein ExbD